MTKKNRKRNYRPEDYRNLFLAPHSIFDFFLNYDAFWQHPGSLKAAHAALGSDMCSNAFFDCQHILKQRNVSKIFSGQLLSRLRICKALAKKNVDWVLGVAYYLPSSSIFCHLNFSWQIAEALGANHDFLEIDGCDFKRERMIFEGRIPRKKNVLVIKEVLVSLAEITNIQRAVKKRNKEVNFLPVVGCIVDLTKENPGKTNIISLIKRNDVWIVDRSCCPLCCGGSRRVRAEMLIQRD